MRTSLLPSLQLKKILSEAVLLLIIAAAAAVVSFLLHPHRPALYLTEEKAEAGEITIKDARALATAGKVLWIDARKSTEHAKGHVPEAIVLNEYEWDSQLPVAMQALQGAMDKTIIVYCDAMKCTASKHIADQIRQFFPEPEKVLVLRGGWPAWSETTK